ncbi:MAG: GNAT family N-acetyltransferase, partial [Legionella sp.]
MPAHYHYTSKKCGLITISQDELSHSITTNRLQLFSFNQCDKKELHAALTKLFKDEDNISLFGAGIPWEDSEIDAFITTEIERWLDNETFGVFAIFNRETKQFMGNLHTHYVAEQFAQVGRGHASVAEIGYILDKEFWGKGYGTELAVAANKYVKHAAAALAADAAIPREIVATVHPDNIGSKKILEKTLRNKNDEREPEP